jgi:transcriptional regulator with XRE-family HTH domain
MDVPTLGIMNNKTRDAICAQVAKMFKEERLRQKLSMNRVAERAGLSYQMISYIERDLRNPTLETMLRIAEALNLNLGAIISEAEKVVKNSQK